MELVDTHTHLYANQFDKDREETLQRAINSGINRFFLPAIDSTTHEAMLRLEASYPERCFAMMGLHPCSVNAEVEKELAIVEQHLNKRSFCAIGEIGIDLHWDTTYIKEQKTAFRRQIQWAKELNKPIVIHSRKSTQEVIEILQEEQDNRLRGIFHCFGGNVEEAQSIIDCGFYLGIGGVLTFKRSGLDDTMRAIDLDKVVLETDAPYLAPAPHRGKRNESAYLRLVAEKLAAIKKVSLEEVARITTQNADNLFGKN